jgi:NAD+ synthase (glutamine-hydrolysing)
LITTGFRLALAQVNVLVGDAAGNADRIAEAVQQADDAGAELVIFPELALSGYPPEDLLFHRGFKRDIALALQRVAAIAEHIDVLLGFPEYIEPQAEASGQKLYNSAAWFHQGKLAFIHRKHCLPNYGVFDEKRYFSAGQHFDLYEIKGVRCGVLICEDIWDPVPAKRLVELGAELVLVLNASPFEQEKQAIRESLLAERARALGVPLIYLNLVGGQDELVFDGQSFAVNASGAVCLRAAAFTESLSLIDVERDPSGQVTLVPVGDTPLELSLDVESSTYQALVMGVRDYVRKHRFPGVLLGLSGGIDSALTLAIAVDALGAEHVQAVMMPSRYTSSMSLEDAAEQARGLGVAYEVISIEPIYSAVMDSLQTQFAGRAADATEENLQSRARMLILMAISNKTGRMLLTTGNKSEMAVGYATLYGDMAGGFAPLKDCSKLWVYRLAAYRNRLSPVIPARVTERAPSAELRPDQKDEDSLPPYAVLDAILACFIEQDMAVDDIVARGFARETVLRVLSMVQRNEYKRRQAPPGVRVSRRAFGRDWRYPITNGYRADI